MCNWRTREEAAVTHTVVLLPRLSWRGGKWWATTVKSYNVTTATGFSVGDEASSRLLVTVPHLLKAASLLKCQALRARTHSSPAASCSAACPLGRAADPTDTTESPRACTQKHTHTAVMTKRACGANCMLILPTAVVTAADRLTLICRKRLFGREMISKPEGCCSQMKDGIKWNEIFNLKLWFWASNPIAETVADGLTAETKSNNWESIST